MLPSVRSRDARSVGKICAVARFAYARNAIGSQVHSEDHDRDLRIGLKESLVEEAIAKAYGGALRKCSARTCCWGHWRDTKIGGNGRLAHAKMGCSIRWASCCEPVESAEEG